MPAGVTATFTCSSAGSSQANLSHAFVVAHHLSAGFRDAIPGMRIADWESEVVNDTAYVHVRCEKELDEAQMLALVSERAKFVAMAYTTVQVGQTTAEIA